MKLRVFLLLLAVMRPADSTAPGSGTASLSAPKPADVQSTTVLPKVQNTHASVRIANLHPPVPSGSYGGIQPERKFLTFSQARRISFRRYQEGKLRTGWDMAGRPIQFTPGLILTGFKGETEVKGVQVPEGSEADALEDLKKDPRVAFAELDVLLKRQFTPNDSLVQSQWHHQKIGSYKAWNIQLGSPSVAVAIVDDPFQMDHPDLAGHVLPGWNIVTNGPVTADPGQAHSTLGAGLAAAVINNATGVAGAANCSVLPITITGFISDMAAAVMWAADHGVRIVNISWDGAYSSTINQAAQYHREKTRGMVVMAGINDVKRLPYPNQPYIYAIAMTDSGDAQLSSHGPHVDFAAPGWAVFSASINGSYDSDSGTSYSAPLFSGVAAMLMSINPAMDGSEIEEILRLTAVDLGEPGPDEYYGFGRIDFGKAAAEAYRRIRIQSPRFAGGQFVINVPYQNGGSYTLLKTFGLSPADWIPVASATFVTNGSTLSIADPDPAPGFYRVEASLPAIP